QVYRNLNYFKVDVKNRGLTRQRNYGISKVSENMEIVCFLDDDIILKADFFERLIETYFYHPDAIGIGGYIIGESTWRQIDGKEKPGEFTYDGWVRKLGERNILRKRLGLLSDLPPGYMP